MPPLAAGENIASRRGFNRALGGDVLQVVQPDIAKWGGLNGVQVHCLRYREDGQDPACIISEAGSFAGAVQPLAGEGVRPAGGRFRHNPLRDRFCGRVVDVRDGAISLSDDPGLGIEPDLASIEQYRTA